MWLLWMVAAFAGVPMEEVRWDVTVRGPLAEAVVTQRFRNECAWAVGATYVFPLPGEDVVDSMRRVIDDDVIEARVQPHAVAQRTFANAAAEGRTAGLTTQEAAGVFQQNVANIPAHASIEVTMRVLWPVQRSVLLRLRDDRPTEVLDLLEAAPYAFWPNQRHGVQALVDLGRYDHAIAYAETKSNPNDHHQIVPACERILRDQGRLDEAYERYALEAHRRGTYLATYRSLAKAYPDFAPQKLLGDLVGSTPGEEGKWFATAKTIGEYDLAIELANGTSCEPKTLIRAARDFEAKEPLFALKASLTALRWLCEGYGYELDGSEVHSAFGHAMAAAEHIGQRDGALRSMMSMVTPEYSGEAWSREALRRKLTAFPFESERSR